MPCGRSSRNTVRVWKVFAVAGADATPREWLHETAVACRVIYDWQRADGTYGKQFVTDTYLLPERQLTGDKTKCIKEEQLQKDR